MNDCITIRCADVRHAGYAIGVGCCNSCHDDEEMFGYDMCSIRSDYPDFIEPQVCCDVANAATDADWLQLILAKIHRRLEQQG